MLNIRFLSQYYFAYLKEVPNVYKNITDNNQNVIAIQMSINQCMDKQNVV